MKKHHLTPYLAEAIKYTKKGYILKSQYYDQSVGGVVYLLELSLFRQIVHKFFNKK